MTRFLLAVCLIAPVSAVTAAPSWTDNYRAPRPAADFPSLDSYYPPAAWRAGQQGTAIMRVCVDAHGNLTEPPVVAETSGNMDLDTGAVNLANAGNGHYEPATQDGVPVQGCGKFKIAFKMRGSAGLPVDDPRFPTIGLRITKLNEELTRRMQARFNELGSPRFLGEAFNGGNPVAERSIRQYARSTDSFIDETVGMAADFLDDVDFLQESPDIPEAERAAFREEWPNNRASLVVDIREIVGSLRDLVRIEDEMGDYVAFSVARRSVKDSRQVQQPVDDPHLNALRQRARAAIEKLQNLMKAKGVAPPAESN